ncbi:NAD(P)/FAD-dependent oxidoreductase [Anianabacter salinae]|uniref:NAD(P)/FAD-dependent oxidoreductase n=1 Tax=Anianabacter salinae TaxID=2851023 RepID=UPI00225E293C|nr:FAD-dependent oxidoreductase [Anianabacter salinae]MBV0911629.1 FAD-binding oxidoreductase [Anianabacter salinae]
MAEVIVLGAGIVGVATALAVQACGHAVTLIDRRAPGEETSFGNAGVIETEGAEPHPLPHDLATLFSYALGRSNDVVWSPGAALRQFPALLRYFMNSGAGRHAAISRHYAPLVARSTADHAPLVEASGAQNLIARDGWAFLFRDARAFDAAVKDAERMARTYGHEARVISGEDYRAEDPALRLTPAGALHWRGAWSCADPSALTKAYAALLQRRGGRIVTGDARSLRQAGAGWAANAKDGEISAAQAIIALGPWSPAILRRFGYRFPMIHKRGYHGHYAAPVAPRRPVFDAANGIVLAPMTRGLRITTGAALVPQDAPADPVQLTRGAQAAAELYDIGARVDEPQWHGTRPFIADLLPITGAAPHHPGLWFNFGHGHHGLTLGPTTATLLAAAMEGEADPLLAPLTPARFR